MITNIPPTVIRIQVLTYTQGHSRIVESAVHKSTTPSPSLDYLANLKIGKSKKNKKKERKKGIETLKMVARQKVLLIGATGETGHSIFNGLQEAGNFVS